MPKEEGREKEVIWEYVKAKLGPILNAGLRRSGLIKMDVLAVIKKLRESRNVALVKKFQNPRQKHGNRLAKRKKLLLLKRGE
jgi:hypothetical protein